MSSLKLRFSGLVAASTLVLGACATTGVTPETPIDLASEEQRAAAERADPLTRARFWAAEYQKEQENIETARYFAKALREIESHDRVIQVVSDTLILYPTDYELLVLLGRSYLSKNQIDQAGQTFGRAISVDNSRPDAFAALGLTYDRAEQHEYAQRAYRKALEIDPKRTATLTNFGLSLALSGDIAGAEGMLRKAVARPDATTQVRQNLALVLGLQGKFDEMQTVDGTAPASIMQSNADVLKSMIDQNPAISAARTAQKAPAVSTPRLAEKIEAAPVGPPIASSGLSEIQVASPATSKTAARSIPATPKAVTKVVAEPKPEPKRVISAPAPRKLKPARPAPVVTASKAPKKITPTVTSNQITSPKLTAKVSPPKAKVPTVEEILVAAPQINKVSEQKAQTARLPGGLRGSLQD